MNTLTRTIPCAAPACTLGTRDSSGLCLHHRRSATVTGPGHRLRIGESTARLAEVAPNEVHAAYSVGGAILDRFPELLLAEGRWVLRNAFGPTDTLTVAGEQIAFEVGTTVVRSGISLTRADDLLVFDAPADVDFATAAAFAVGVRNSRWIEIAFTGGLRADTAEHYDDAAEVLASLGLTDGSGAAVSFSARRDGGVTAVVSVETSEGRKIERYPFANRLDFTGSRVTITAFATDGATIATGLDGAREPLSEWNLAMRSGLLDSISAALSLVEKFAVRVDGELLLPVGWNERNL